MKNARWYIFLFLSMHCLCYGASNLSNSCTTAKVLTQIKPGAAWVMQGDSMKNLKWLDTQQSKPSAADVEKAKQTCIADAKARDALKAQARLEVKNPSITTDKKVQDLILLLDLDK